MWSTNMNIFEYLTDGDFDGPDVGPLVGFS